TVGRSRQAQSSSRCRATTRRRCRWPASGRTRWSGARVKRRTTCCATWRARRSDAAGCGACEPWRCAATRARRSPTASTACAPPCWSLAAAAWAACRGCLSGPCRTTCCTTSPAPSPSSRARPRS
ncbi:hypothetical protein HK405_008771, partial [Cladochytrium tenue]